MKRNPAWTDRVLMYCTVPGWMEIKSYDSHNLVATSDHRPVIAQFLMKLDLTNHESEAEEDGPASGVAADAVSSMSKVS